MTTSPPPAPSVPATVPTREVIVRQVQAPTIFNNEEKFVFAQRAAKLLAASQLVPAHLRGRVEDCVIALDIAERMNEHPMVVLQNIYIVSGKPGWSTSYMIARANKSGLFATRINWKVQGKGESLAVTAYATLAETGEVVEATVSMETARADGWTKNDKYKSMPETMLRYRAATLLIRLYAPEVMLGLPAVSVEDLEVERMIDVTPRVVPPAPATPAHDAETGEVIEEAQFTSAPAQSAAPAAPAAPAAAPKPRSSSRRSQKAYAEATAREEAKPEETAPAAAEEQQKQQEQPEGVSDEETLAECLTLLGDCETVEAMDETLEANADVVSELPQAARRQIEQAYQARKAELEARAAAVARAQEEAKTNQAADDFPGDRPSRAPAPPAVPAAPDPEDYDAQMKRAYDAGFKAHGRGDERRAPKPWHDALDLTESWTNGWDDAKAKSVNAQREAQRSAAPPAPTGPSAAPSEATVTVEQQQKAYDDGGIARRMGKTQRLMPDAYKAVPALSQAWMNGWNEGKDQR